MQIEAKIIAHSKSSVNGKEIVTFELDYPRFIHSELLTHRLFSRNAASSRAIPVAKMIEMVRENPAMPVRFGANQAGMQDKGVEHTALVYIEELHNTALANGLDEDRAELFASINSSSAWRFAANKVAGIAEAFSNAGYHKQIVNRILEPFQWMKTVVTATEFDNWFWLRNHPDAQPEIKRLAEVMWEALQNSSPVVLSPGEWHLPYVHIHRNELGGLQYCAEDNERGAISLTLEEALAISSSCCAQVSYRKLDNSLDKAQDIFKRLIESKPCHASPCEHQATPMDYTNKYDCTDDGVNVARFPWSWEKGITHADCDGNLWSGNFKNWIQHRQLIKENVCWNYQSNT